MLTTREEILLVAIAVGVAVLVPLVVRHFRRATMPPPPRDTLRSLDPVPHRDPQENAYEWVRRNRVPDAAVPNISMIEIDLEGEEPAHDREVEYSAVVPRPSEAKRTCTKT